MSIPGTRVLVAFIMICSAVSIILIQTPESADAVGDVLVSVHLDPNAQTVDVDLARGGIVTFEGYIETEQWVDLDAQYAIIQLTGDAGDWPVTEIPILTATKTFTRIPFTVSVMVPQLTTTSELESGRTLTVSGSWSYEPNIREGVVEPVEAVIHVKQFFQYSVKCDHSFIHTAPGGEFDIELEISNEGNGDDEIKLEIMNRDKMESNGWAFVYDRAKYDLPHDKSVIIPVHIVTPTKWHAWKNRVNAVRFTLSSDRAQEYDIYEEVTYSVFIRQRGVSLPGFGPLITSLAIISASGSAFILSSRRRV